MPRISVLIGIYNCASTLVEALDSLYAQTYQDFKIILCEDGSSDDNYDVAKKYAEKHDNILLLRNEKNRGLNYTLNRCLEHADTEYCARMDGDDISLPTRFEKEIEFLDKNLEYAVVSSPMIYFDEEGDFRIGRGYGQVLKKDFLKGSPICHAHVCLGQIS
jgi:glycosyltransferase EpsE